MRVISVPSVNFKVCRLQMEIANAYKLIKMKTLIIYTYIYIELKDQLQNE